MSKKLILKQQHNNNSNQINKLQQELRALKSEIHIYDKEIVHTTQFLTKMRGNRLICSNKYHILVKKLTNMLLREAGLSELIEKEL